MAAAPSSVLDALAREYGLRQKDYVLIEKLVQMSPAERDGIFRFMQDVVDGARGCAADPDAPVFPSGAPLTQDEPKLWQRRSLFRKRDRVYQPCLREGPAWVSSLVRSDMKNKNGNQPVSWFPK